jgi:uncharacterized glyoxalase superfamily protein PhnB
MTNGVAGFNATTLGCSITCKELETSLRFYRDVLGFAVDMTFEKEGALAGAVISAGDIRIVLNQDDGKLGWDRIKGQGCYLQINVNGAADVDAAAARIKVAGGTLLSDPEDRPWDLVGIAVGEQPRRGASPGHPVAARIVDNDEIDAARLFGLGAQPCARATTDYRLAASDHLLESTENLSARNRRHSKLPPPVSGHACDMVIGRRRRCKAF